MATTTPPQPSSIAKAIDAQRPIILDGALATYLEALGADISGSLWSADILLKNPSLIKQAHLDYYRAGAQVAITASYQASLPGLLQHLGPTTEEQAVQEVVKTSVRLAQQARDEYVSEIVAATRASEMAAMLEQGGDCAGYSRAVKAGLWVAGSVGPYGAFLANGSEYRGDYSLSRDAMKAFHRGRIAALVEAGADLLAIETIPSKDEVQALLELLRDEFPGVKAWFTFTLAREDAIADGTALGALVPLFKGVEQVLALGFNCVPDGVGLAAVRILKSLLDGQGMGGMGMVIYPNSGEQWNAQARGWEGKRTEGGLLAEKTREWYAAGARLIGGCCRTTPGDIGVMRDALEGLRQ